MRVRVDQEMSHPGVVPDPGKPAELLDTLADLLELEVVEAETTVLGAERALLNARRVLAELTAQRDDYRHAVALLVEPDAGGV